ncbi:MAG: ABC transporter ATP-binding protein [Paucibacter sp.]|nr:ABC transporter ATP-binding protein [Roseateles sp.]
MPAFRDFSLALRVLFGGADRTVAWRLVAANLLALAAGALAGLAPLALKEMIDAASQVTSAQSPAISIAGFGAAYLVCLSIGRLMTELRPLLVGTAEQCLYAGLRRRYFKHVLALPLDFHLGRRTGALVHGLQQAISGYQILMFSLVNSVVPVLVEGVTVAIVLISLGLPALTATFAATAIAYVMAVALHTGDLSATARAVSKASIDANALLSDSLINYEPIKCFGAEHKTLASFVRSSSLLECCWANLQRRRLRLGLTVTMIFSLSMITSLVIASQAVAAGKLSVGGFVLANLYMVQLMRPLEMLSTAVRDLSQGLAFVRPLIDVLQTPTETTRDNQEGPSSDEKTKQSNNPQRAVSLSFRGVQLAFDTETPVLKDFNLDVPAGRSMAIVGASGCGKSSLVRLLLRLCVPQAGTILMDDVEIDTMPIAALRAMIAVVPQDVVLFNTSIAANIGIGKEGATQDQIADAARLAELHDFITALPCGYDTMIGERGLKLSGGERQRIALARAILRNPLVYVFDEASSMLDGPTESAILRNLKKISTGRTTITIAHRLSAIQHADEIAVVAGGRVVEQGDHATLLARSGAYAAMWRAQQSSGPN